MKILPGEHWYDCGANAGAFSLLANSLGATVTAFEPDPFTVKVLRKNLAFNDKTEVIQRALVHDDTKEANLFVGHNNMVWRNSICKNWNGKGVKVDCINFDEAVPNGACVKIDIEGAEMKILETTKHTFKKLVFEWSFDIDGSLNRFRACIDKMSEKYNIKIANPGFYNRADDFCPKNFIAKATNVYCHAKN
jgi:FkbM family methyltransferase